MVAEPMFSSSNFFLMVSMLPTSMEEFLSLEESHWSMMVSLSLDLLVLLLRTFFLLMVAIASIILTINQNGTGTEIYYRVYNQKISPLFTK